MGQDPPKRTVSWSLLGFGVAVAGPALWIGGALPEVVPVFCLVVAGLWWRASRKAARPLIVPWAALLGVVATATVLAQWLPWAPLRGMFAAELAAQVDTTLAGTGVVPWAGMTVVPGDTALEAARLVGLTLLFVVAAQRSWRWSAAIVAATGAAVAVVGFAHDSLGVDRIYGVYAMQEVAPHVRPALLTSFVNPNHQASLLLMGLFSAAALALHEQTAALRASDPAVIDRHRDRAFAGLAAVTLQLPALVLSLSRGALVALLLAVPVALGLALGHRPPPASRPSPRATVLRPRVLAAAGLMAVTLIVASHGAWAELRTLADFDAPNSSAAHKVRLVRDALGMVAWDRPLGVGRGAFVDLFGAVDSVPTHIAYTHVESVPAGWLIELGWLGGGLLVLGVVGWFGAALLATRGQPDAVGRRIVWLGLAAMAIQNALDFGFELLGVAAAAVVLAGGLSPRGWRVPVARVRLGGVVVLVGAAALAVWALPHTYAHRGTANAAVRSGATPGLDVLRMRPLDGDLHGLLARRAAEAQRWPEAERWATHATTRRPGAPDPWLIGGAAQHAAGHAAASEALVREGLARLHAPLGSDLVDYLLLQFPTPPALARVAPVAGDGWVRLVTALQDRAPRHADAVAAARTAVDPDDPRPAFYRHHLALKAKQPALALHHARIWRALDPSKALAHVAVARALGSFVPPRWPAARDTLESALAQVAFATQAERGVVEEELLITLLALGDEVALQRARALLAPLRSRPASRSVSQRRQRLAHRVQDATPRP